MEKIVIRRGLEECLRGGDVLWWERSHDVSKDLETARIPSALVDISPFSHNNNKLLQYLQDLLCAGSQDSSEQAQSWSVSCLKPRVLVTEECLKQKAL